MLAPNPISLLAQTQCRTTPRLAAPNQRRSATLGLLIRGPAQRPQTPSATQLPATQHDSIAKIGQLAYFEKKRRRSHPDPTSPRPDFPTRNLFLEDTPVSRRINNTCRYTQYNEGNGQRVCLAHHAVESDAFFPSRGELEMKASAQSLSLDTNSIFGPVSILGRIDPIW